MLTRFSISNVWIVLAVAFGIGLAGRPSLSAATVSWDAALSGGTAVGGTGNWAAASSNWWSGTDDQEWNNVNGDTAVFAGTAGTVTLSGSQSAGGLTFSSTGGYALTGSTLYLAGSAPAVSITTPTTNTIQSILAGTGGLTIQAGSGTLALAASNSYSGGTLIEGGTLSIKSDAALGTAPGGPTTNLTFNGGGLTFTGSMTLNANRIVNLGASGGTLNVLYTATGNINNSTTVGVRLTGQFTGNGGLTLTGGSGANISGTAPYLFLLDSLANNYTGTTTINNATVINDAGVDAVNILPVTTVLTLTNSAVFGFYLGNATQTLAGLTGDSTTAIGTANTSTTASLTIDPAANKTYTYAGTIGDVKVLSQGDQGTGGAAFSLTINGQGAEILSGTNLYTGATNISSGTLGLNNGSLAGGGAVTVAANGTLAGAGTIAGATVVNGRLNPALGGSLSFSKTLTLNSGSTFVLQAGGGTVGSVKNVTTLNATGALTLMPVALDNTTFNGSNNFPFLSWTTSGPAAGVQGNWSIFGPNIVTWTGAGDELNWSDSGNWSGSNVSGGTIQAVYNSGSSGPGYLEVNGLSITSGLTSVSNAVIQNSTGVTVTCPSAATSVQGLSLGSGTGSLNTLNLSAGPLCVTGPTGTTVNATGVLNIGSGTLQTTALSIAGSVSLGASGSLAASGAVNVNNLGVVSLGSSGYAAPTMTVNPGGILAGTVANAFAFSGTSTVTVNGQLQVLADGGLNNISNNVVVGAGGEYNFTAQQSDSPTLTILAGVGLFGNLTNFTYGNTGSVSLAANAVLSPTAGNLPTRGQLGGAILLMPLAAADTGSTTVGDDGSTSIYKGVSLGSWTTVGGVPIASGAQLIASNGTLNFSTLPSVPFSGTITDSASNGFTFYLNGQNTTLTTTASLNTPNTAVGVEFDGLGNVSFPAAGANPGGSASVYSRIGLFDALNTSGGTLPNTTGNQTLLTLPDVANNLAGKTLNLQDLTFNAVSNVNAQLIASSGTVNFNAYSAMYNSGTTFTQGTFNFAPTAIYRIGGDTRLTSGSATWNFQTGAMVSIAEATVNTSLWSVPSNVDLVLSSESDPIVASGTTGIVLGDGRTLSSPWNTSAIALNLSASTALNAAPGATSVRLAGANGQALTINGPLELGSATLIINDIPFNTLYVPANGDSDFTRQPGGSLLNGTVLLSNTTATASVVPAVYVKGGTLRLASAGALGPAPAITVGAPDAGATAATLDLDGHNLAVTSLSGAVVGVITNSNSAAPAALSVSFTGSTTSIYAGTLTDGSNVLSLTISGQGTEVLTGSSFYTGGTTISGGTLQLGDGTSGHDGSILGNVTNNSALVYNLFGSQTYSGAISGSGTVSKTGGGLLQLAGGNSYGGGTTVSGGTLQLANNSALGTAAGPLSITGATLDLNGNSPTVSTLTGDSGALITNSGGGAVTLTLGPLIATTTYGGRLQDGAGTLSLVVNGSGSLWLTGTNAYSGGTTVSGGTLAITNAASLGSGSLAIGPATLEVAGNFADGRNISLTDPATTVQVDSSFVYCNSGSLSGTGGLTLSGPGTLVLAGTSSYFGGTDLEFGTLIVGNSGALPAGSSLTVGAGSTFIFDPNGPAGSAMAAASPAGAVEAVPEPGSLALLSVAGIVTAAAAWRRRWN